MLISPRSVRFRHDRRQFPIAPNQRPLHTALDPGDRILLQHAPLRERGGQPQFRQQRSVPLEGPPLVRRIGAQPEGLKPLPVIDEDDLRLTQVALGHKKENLAEGQLRRLGGDEGLRLAQQGGKQGLPILATGVEKPVSVQVQFQKFLPAVRLVRAPVGLIVLYYTHQFFEHPPVAPEFFDAICHDVSPI